MDVEDNVLISALQSKVPRHIIDDMGDFDTEEGEIDQNLDAWMRRFRITFSLRNKTETFKSKFRNMVQKSHWEFRVYLNHLRTAYARGWPDNDVEVNTDTLKTILDQFRKGMHRGPKNCILNAVTSQVYMNLDNLLYKKAEVVFETLISACDRALDIARGDYDNLNIGIDTGREMKSCATCGKTHRGRCFLAEKKEVKRLDQKPGGSRCEESSSSDTSTTDTDGEVKAVGNMESIECYQCKKKGHFRRDCPEKSRTPVTDGKARWVSRMDSMETSLSELTKLMRQMTQRLDQQQPASAEAENKESNS